MGVLAQQMERIFSAGTPAPGDDYWYRPYGTASATGLRFAEADVLKASAALACVRVLSESVAALPCVLYRRERDAQGRVLKSRDPEQPLYSILHDRPNDLMSAFDFWQLAIVFAALWGTFYAEIQPGARGFVDQLWPLHPDTVKPEWLPGRRLRYKVRDPATGGERILLQEEVLRIPGLSLDGLIGQPVLALVRETIALALAAEGYAARLFRQGSTLGILSTEQVLPAEQRKALEESWATARAGVENAHKTAFLDRGFKWQPIGLDAEKTQLQAVRKEQAIEIARVFRVQPAKIGIYDQSTRANVEQQALEFVQDTLAPWLKRIAQAVSRDLIAAPETWFAEFLVDARMWADGAARSAFYTGAILNGWMTRNEVRVLENLNPLDGLDEPLSPLNMRQGANAPQPAREPGTVAQMDVAEGMGAPAPAPMAVSAPIQPSMLAESTRMHAVVRAAAERLARREIAAVAKAAERHAQDLPGWHAWLETFYAEHAVLVAEALAIEPGRARRYCDSQQAALREQGLIASAAWERTLPDTLAALALEEAA